MIINYNNINKIYNMNKELKNKIYNKQVQKDTTSLVLCMNGLF